MLKALLAMTRFISSNQPIQKVVHRLVDELKDLLGAARCSVLILDEDNQAVEYFNANDNNLEDSQNYDLLKQMLISIAENQ